ncbi:SGNH/GDSL hydrolase N-terminal domain-containing protein [Cohnella sp. GCM10027633]|uniref:SGNH/GDSL hydrolase N-terminal domain-containing protein n=1 Tax=unclassified Cohnella TaxID=2636738 RepID=UPI00363A1C21
MSEARQTPLGELDENMRIDSSPADGLRWLSPKEEPFRIVGFAWYDQEKQYRRLPANPDYPIPPAIEELASHCAGGQIRFRTNSSRLSVRVVLGAPPSADHMTAVAECGIDCYVGTNGELRFGGTTRFDRLKDRYECSLMKGLTSEMRDIVLNLPLYQSSTEHRDRIRRGRRRRYIAVLK